jgi:hypothetical protein
MPELEQIRCEREQVLMDADSSLDHVFFPDIGVVSATSAGPTPHWCAIPTEDKRKWRLGLLRVAVPYAGVAGVLLIATAR